MEKAVESVKSFKSHKKFTIVGTKGKDLKIKVGVENINSGIQTETKALVDSGTTGSCVHKDFTAKYGLNMRKLPVKMPVYNADGTLNLYPPFNATLQPKGDSDDDNTPPQPGATDQCGNPVSTVPGGTFNFIGMIQHGFLNADGTAAEGTVYRYDNCTQTVENIFQHWIITDYISIQAIRI